MWGSQNGSKDQDVKNDAAGAKQQKQARPTRATSTVDTLIGRQSEVTGDIRFSGGLHIDGRIKGKVIADSDKNAVLSISESGHVEGDIRVPHVVLNGTVEGDVHASQRITLSAKARVNGNVYYKLIEMTGGAMVNGQMVFDGEGAEKVASLSAAGTASSSDQDEESDTSTSSSSTSNFGAGRLAAANRSKTSL